TVGQRETPRKLPQWNHRRAKGRNGDSQGREPQARFFRQSPIVERARLSVAVTTMTNAYDVPLPKFSLGRIVMAESATQTLLLRDISTALLRHARGDWGDVCTEDRD